jgi:hypothetical protein
MSDNNVAITEYSRPEIDDEVVMIKVEDGRELAWKSARGSASLSEDDKWSPNPEQAKIYKGVAEVATAIKRYQSANPNVNQKLIYAKYDEFALKNRKYQYETISEALAYDNKAKVLYVLEFGNSVRFYLSQDDRQKDIRSNVGYRCYTINKFTDEN